MFLLHTQRATENSLSGGQSRARRGCRCSGRSGQRGLTLVELLIAVALLGFVLLGIAPLFIASVKSNYSANEYTSINILARDRLEQVMNLTFNDPLLSVGFHVKDQAAFLPDPTNPSLLSTVPNPFAVTYQVSQWSLPPMTGLGSPASGVAFVPTRVVLNAKPFQYKRIDVEVRVGTGPLGIGSRVSRVSGVLNNPSPTADVAKCGTVGVVCSLTDPCAGGVSPCFF
jgi:prepilin-type N-terminal cleavage/methylation domain-containing protein